MAELAGMAAVAALVVALLSPVVGAARLSEGAVRCLDNQHRIGQAMLRYVDDYHGVFPPFRQVGGDRTWKDAIAPYLKLKSPSASGTNSVWRCPSNPARAKVDDTGRRPRSYALNAAPEWVKQSNGNGGSLRVTTRDFKNPAGVILVMESRNSQPDIGPWLIDGKANPDGSGWSNPNVVWMEGSKFPKLGCFHHHDKRLNLIMVDGHTVSASLPRTVQAPQMWDPWNAPDAYLSKLAGMLSEYK